MNYELLSVLRKACGLRQADLADALDICRLTLIKVEKGRDPFTLGSLRETAMYDLFSALIARSQHSDKQETMRYLFSQVFGCEPGNTTGYLREAKPTLKETVDTVLEKHFPIQSTAVDRCFDEAESYVLMLEAEIFRREQEIKVLRSKLAKYKGAQA